ncbi:MAG: hypothetical protein ACLSB9_23400 [Hydrogeniiclostridium mannosilyticum]
MNELLQIVIEHGKKYPVMQPDDAVKLVYQNEFGGGHFIQNPNASLLRLKDEQQRAASVQISTSALRSSATNASALSGGRRSSRASYGMPQRAFHSLFSRAYRHKRGPHDKA